MFSTRIDELTETHIQNMVRDEQEESIRLDYKRDLDLSTRPKRAEAAKDVAALANTAGGRLVYGIAEDPGQDGVPDSIVPLTDEDLPRRLEDILLAAITPRPRFRMRRVEVQGGYALVVEVYASDYDLHQVSGYGDNRFYARSEKRTVIMSEPEIRERYVRLAQERGAIEDRVEQVAQQQLARWTQEGESMIVAPVFGRPGMFNPALLDIAEIRQQLSLEPQRHSLLFDRMHITGEGYTSDLDLSEAGYYLLIRRDGIVHTANVGSFFGSTEESPRYLPAVTLREVLWTILVAEKAMQISGYWGPLRIFYRVHSARERHVENVDRTPRPSPWMLPAGDFTARTWANMSELTGREMAAVRDVMDQVWQHLGKRCCDWFGVDGELKSQVVQQLPFQLPTPR